jgi:hypothetical protein
MDITDLRQGLSGENLLNLWAYQQPPFLDYPKHSIAELQWVTT